MIFTSKTKDGSSLSLRCMLQPVFHSSPPVEDIVPCAEGAQAEGEDSDVQEEQVGQDEVSKLPRATQALVESFG